MNKKRCILFIVNPISGGRSKRSFEAVVQQYLSTQKYNYVIMEAQYPNHASELVRTYAHAVDVVVAVGGDGTINEVAREAAQAQLTMGIVPFGSGNGLARHLGIPLQVRKAVAMLNTAVVHSIDTATLNGNFFLSVAGIGFDSLVARTFSTAKGRGFANYAKAGFYAYFNYQEQLYRLVLDGKTIERKAFMITIANSNQFGYNAKISPLASVQDGWLDVCVLKKPTVFTAPYLLSQFFAGRAHTSSFLEIIRAKQISITPNTSNYANIDGETMKVGAQVHISIKEKNLNILLAKQQQYV